jgi:hypothetical protein
MHQQALKDIMNRYASLVNQCIKDESGLTYWWGTGWINCKRFLLPKCQMFPPSSECCKEDQNAYLHMQPKSILGPVCRFAVNPSSVQEVCQLVFLCKIVSQTHQPVVFFKNKAVVPSEGYT